jgi:glyoxylase-like metal-dependent hydrolase (beta-lactamase superfamily II)
MESNELRGVTETSTPMQHLAMDSLGLLQEMTDQKATLDRIAPDVMYMRILMVNVCFISSKDGWLLVDTGLPDSTESIIAVAKEQFGGKKPQAIILTHGHFDHVGAITELAKQWDVPIYAHELELPFLTGQKDYLLPDPSVSDGLMAKISQMYPNQAINLGDRVNPIPKEGGIPEIPEWRWLHTPGHTPGHISLFRESDGLLIAGDAFTTVQQESALAVIKQEKEIHGPPPYFTTEWNQAWESVKKLEALKPSIVISGHGLPMEGKELSKQLAELVRNFDEIAIPEHGRYVP